ncbi:TIGR02391 family protein [Leifsonia virtsii]|uniref:TIGR02391 family protein n=1 Tax=Leifsonia virtsii TaxID=3035915 RepID=A0ABT8J0K7_9MICO|nr:TIGR02391 family protein [Leifsonia virtsii]MDN4598585.1 TIGR02391 family protein [Leifsonia virtsii]
MNSEWALAKLDSLQESVDRLRDARKKGAPAADERRAIERELLLRKVPVEAIAQELFEDWRWHWSDSSSYLSSAIQRIRGEILFRSEIEENLQADSPLLRADRMHGWVWQSARSLWESGHHSDAVETAAKKVNAEIQNKVGRRDISDSTLCIEAFSAAPPVPGKNRLRFDGPRDSTTWKSRQEGAMHFARGAFMAIRNPLAHEEQLDLREHEALELLAAFSVIARWVDMCAVEVAEQE